MNYNDPYGYETTTSLDLPQSLSDIMRMPSPGATAPYSYAVGGMIGPGGAPQPTGAGLAPQGQGQTGAPMSPQMLEMHINQFASQNPQQVAQIRQAIMQEMQSGELTPQELNTIIQLAQVAAQNPEMYPYVRNFAIQQGIATEQDLPQQYDQGLVITLLIAAKAIQQSVGGQDMASGGTPATIPSMATGGPIPDAKSRDGSVLINAHEGEYVIPKRVVEMKGKEFFDTLVEKYTQPQS